MIFHDILFISTTQTAAQTSCVSGDDQGLLCDSAVPHSVPLAFFLNTVHGAFD